MGGIVIFILQVQRTFCMVGIILIVRVCVDKFPPVHAGKPFIYRDVIFDFVRDFC